MGFKKIFCPNCGQQTQVDVNRAFCFCLECGNKIILNLKENKIVESQITEDVDENSPDNDSDELTKNKELEKKLEEVSFYYNLSNEKKEYKNVREEPMYYLKAQDILVDLTEEYPDDYRIWWELCKPVDFYISLSGTDCNSNYGINEEYFGKALDRAEINEKKVLIEEHDNYIANKKIMQIQREKEQLEEEKKKHEKEREEQQRVEDAKRMEEEDRQRKEEEKIRIRQEGIAQSEDIWRSLKNKEYLVINDNYFSFELENNQTIIGVFKMVSNMLYLMAFRIDGNKSNVLYREQTMSIKFDDKGHGLKHDNKPVRIKGFSSPHDILWITLDGMGGLAVNGMPLIFNTEYVGNVIKFAKKPLVSFTKIFN